MKFKTIVVSAIFALSINVANAGEKLSLYHWFEYIPQELLDKFESETGIDVTMDTYDSNESLLAALKAGKLGSYDLAVPGDYMVEILAGEGMLDTIGDGELKNKSNIESQWLDASFDRGRKHSVPYQWGSTSFSVNRDVYKGNINTTDIIFNPFQINLDLPRGDLNRVGTFTEKQEDGRRLQFSGPIALPWYFLLFLIHSIIHS